MANNYMYFSFGIPLQSQAEEEWAQKFLNYADSCVTDWVKPDHGPESTALMEAFPDWNEWQELGFDWEIDGNAELHIYAEAGEGNTSSVAGFLQAYLRKFENPGKIGFEFCWTCSQSRKGEFGGGACVVTTETEEWWNSAEWLEKKLAK